MKIIEQTRKSVADWQDTASMLQTKLAELAQNTILRLLIKRTQFKEIFDEYSEEKKVNISMIKRIESRFLNT